MMRIETENYDVMRRWLAAMAPVTIPADMLTSDTDPITALDAIMLESPSKARQGLAMAVGDVIEQTSHWPREAVANIDRQLLNQELPSLSAVRLRFSDAIRAILRRGRIDGEVEYYAVRNVADDSTIDSKLLKMIADYERRQGK